METAASVTQIQLRDGQACWMHAARDTELFVQSGTITILPAPRWDDVPVMPRLMRLREHEVYVVEDAGWITVSALGAADIVCHQRSRVRLQTQYIRRVVALLCGRRWRTPNSGIG